MTAPASAYPRTVEDLLPHAHALAVKLGEIPSRNALMREFSIGGPKAGLLRDALSLPTDLDTPPVAPQPETVPTADTEPLATVDGPPDTASEAVAPSKAPRPLRSWPVYVIALPAAVAIWSGWVGLGGLTGFGVVHPLPGIWDSFSINTAITLPIGVEAYAAYALKAWLSGNRVPQVARRFAKWSAIASLLVGSAGQIAFHLMESRGMTTAPWQITTVVACLPVIVLGMGAALAHLLNSEDEH